MSFFGVDLAPKQLALLHEVVPNAAVIALLVDQNVPDAVAQVPAMQEAARTLGLQLVVLLARTASDIDAAFATIVRERAGALVVGTGALLTNRRKQIIALAARHALPTIYPFREFTADGGLISYGNNVPDTFRQGGVYAGRILKGDKPADLPVILSTKFEFVLNRKTAKALGLDHSGVARLHRRRGDRVVGFSKWHLLLQYNCGICNSALWACKFCGFFDLQSLYRGWRFLPRGQRAQLQFGCDRTIHYPCPGRVTIFRNRPQRIRPSRLA